MFSLNNIINVPGKSPTFSSERFYLTWHCIFKTYTSIGEIA